MRKLLIILLITAPTFAAENQDIDINEWQRRFIDTTFDIHRPYHIHPSDFKQRCAIGWGEMVQTTNKDGRYQVTEYCCPKGKKQCKNPLPKTCSHPALPKVEDYTVTANGSYSFWFKATGGTCRCKDGECWMER